MSLENTISPQAQYKSRLDAGTLKPDPEQGAAIAELDRLYHEIVAYKPKSGFFRKKIAPPPKGIYMHGGVGRGKTMLMDLFFDCLPAQVPKRRVHFHAFMIDVHDYIHARRKNDKKSEGVSAVLPELAQKIATQSRVLCFDEFHVVDVADAMILGRLFRALFELGVVVVCTTNWEPDRLYEGGLQRDRFLPFIALLKEKQEVVHLDSPHDYRTQFLMREGSYFTPLSDETTRKANTVFNALTDDVCPEEEELQVKGRKIHVGVTAKGVARFDFDYLCAAKGSKSPFGAEDYLSIAARYHSVFIEGIPVMETAQRNEAKRLMILIDVLYESGVNVVITAQALPEGLYVGSDHSFEFERTVSRLREMQSVDYISRGQS